MDEPRGRPTSRKAKQSRKIREASNMFNDEWLQYFADAGGAPAGDGDGGAESGVSPADAGQVSIENTLAKMGVPKDKVDRFAASRKRRGIETPTATAPATEQPEADAPDVAPTQDEQPPDGGTAEPKVSFEELLKDPEYKAAFDTQVTGIMQKRLAKANAREENMAKLSPALNMLAKKYGVQAGDYGALASSIMDDDNLYRERASELGVDVKTAKFLQQKEQEVDTLRTQQKASIQQQMMKNHLDRLNRQAQELKSEYPDFNLDTEMNNDMFVKLTQPGMLSVKDAYIAVHRAEIDKARQQAMQQQALTAAQAAVRAGQARPKENGSTAAAPITRVPPAQRSKAERAELRRRIMDAGARGEKLPIDW